MPPHQLPRRPRQVPRFIRRFKSAAPGSAALALLAALAAAPPAAAAPRPDKPAPQRPADPREEKLTQANFDKVTVGMTKEQVLDLLGPNRSSAGQGNDWTLGWRFTGDSTHRADVHFKNGVVVSKHSTIDWAKHGAAGAPAGNAPAGGTTPAGAAADSAITKANFEKLHAGMTSAEVKAVLGEPAKSESASAGRSGMLWTAGHKFALVMFKDDKAVDMDCSEVPPAAKAFTPRLYARLYDDMPQEEALALLGQPDKDESLAKGSRKIWQQGEQGSRDQRHILLIFEQGKLTKKTASPEVKDAPLLAFEVTADDKIVRNLEALKSGDSKRVGSALEFFAHTPRDDAHAEHAEEISQLAERYYSGKDFGLKMAARGALEQWCTRANSGYFIKVLERHGRGDPRRATNDDQDFALEILTKLKDPDAVPAIAKMLLHFFDRDSAVKALIAFGPELAQAEVVKYANHKDPDVARAAREVLERFKASPAVLLDRNLADLKSSSADQRLWAAQAIEKMDVVPNRRKEVAAALEPLLADKYAWPAHAAAAALVKWGGPENTPALAKALTHASPDMRRLAANALRDHGTREALPALQAAVAKADPVHPEAAAAAKEAIAAINTRR